MTVNILKELLSLGFGEWNCFTHKSYETRSTGQLHGIRC